MRLFQIMCFTIVITSVLAKSQGESERDRRDGSDVSHAIMGSKGEDTEQIVRTEKHSDKTTDGWAVDKQPNIIFLLADDLGWNDVSWHNADVIAPNMKALVKGGIELDNSYVQNVCTPSRHSIMTGINPIHAGMQHGVIMPDAPECSPLDHEFLPQALKKLGYGTHMLGKWHLGMCDWKCTPTYRGFDSFYGFYQGYVDHYNHTYGNGHDWRDGEESDNSGRGKFATDLLTDRALSILKKQNPKKPFFLYFAYNNVHIPLQVPQQFYDLYKDRADMSEDRKIYLGMVSSMDDSIGKLVQVLKDRGLYDNTLLVFSSDNGGEEPAGNNHPLRGAKGSLFDGGMRAAAFVHSPLLSKWNGKKLDQMMHATDWLPTFVSLAGGTPSACLDGFDQSGVLFDGAASKRDTIIHGIDETYPQTFGRAAIRKGDWKLISGYVGLSDGRDGDYMRPYHMEEYQQFMSKKKRSYEMSDEEILAQTACIDGMEGNAMLFNMRTDPNEEDDVADANPDKVKELQDLLDEAARGAVPFDPNNLCPVAAANPSFHNGEWEPGWCTK